MRQLACLLLLVGSCKSREREPTKTEDPVVGDRSIHHLDAPAAQLPHHEYTRVIEPGAEPRSVARYKLAPGTTTYRATTEMKSRLFADHVWGEWSALPAIADGFAVTADGKQLAIRALPAEVADPTPASDQYVAAERQLAARAITVTFDDRGQLGPIAIDGIADAALTDYATQRLLAMIVQLPEEPIGIGAAWRAVDVLRQRPAIVKQTASYTLVKRTESTLTLAVEIVRNGQQQTVVDPALPAGTDAELQSLHRTLTGTVVIDLARPMFEGALALDARMHVKLAPPSGPVQEQMFDDSGKVSVKGH